MDDFDINAIDISQLFETTTAVSTQYHTDADRANLHRRGAFERFSKNMQESAGVLAGIGEFQAFAVLVSQDMRRHYKVNEGENVEQFAQRLRGEAIAMNARWSFIAMLSPYAIGNLPENTPVGDLPSILNAVEEGKLALGICFFAEKSEDQRRVQRSGVIELDKRGAPRNVISGTVPAEGNPFTSVMDR